MIYLCILEILISLGVNLNKDFTLKLCMFGFARGLNVT